MKIPAQLKADNIYFGRLIPSGNVLSVREEWLCEWPPFSHRWQIQVATPLRDCVTPFCDAASELKARIEKWGPQGAFVRATDNQGSWGAVLSDVSTDVLPMVVAILDLRMLPESEVVEGAREFAEQQKELLPLAPLWNELFLSIVMASLERAHDGGVKGSVQLPVDDVKWPEVRRWLAAHRFLEERNDEWFHQEQNKLFVFRTPGKVWCGLKESSHRESHINRLRFVA